SSGEPPDGSARMDHHRFDRGIDRAAVPLHRSRALRLPRHCEVTVVSALSYLAWFRCVVEIHASRLGARSAGAAWCGGVYPHAVRSPWQRDRWFARAAESVPRSVSTALSLDRSPCPRPWSEPARSRTLRCRRAAGCNIAHRGAMRAIVVIAVMRDRHAVPVPQVDAHRVLERSRALRPNVLNESDA